VEPPAGLGDAEVDDDGASVGGDEDVVGLEVAVDDAVEVGVVDAGADLHEGAEEAESSLLGGVARGLPGVDGHAVDELHDDGDASVGEGA
jgi:hypothetical protein